LFVGVWCGWVCVCVCVGVCVWVGVCVCVLGGGKRRVACMHGS
jgi:hypothetical protein